MGNLHEVRKIDELGRIVLPIVLRQEMGWDIRDSLLVAHDAENGTVTLKLYEKSSKPICNLCKANEPKVTLNGIGICESCIEGFKAM